MATNIAAEDWISKYKSGAAVANHICDQLEKLCVAGISINDLICFGELELTTEGETKSLEKGWAFPICISVNNCVQYSSVNVDSKKRIVNGDIVKLELAVHVDGFPSFVGHTVVAGDMKDVSSRQADVLLAAHNGLEAVLRTMKVGNTIETALQALKLVCTEFLCQPIDGLFIQKLNQFGVVPHGRETAFQIDEVYCVKILVQSSEGAAIKFPKKTVFQRINTEKSTESLGVNARNLLEYVDSNLGTFPFAVRKLPDKRMVNAIPICVTRQFLKQFPSEYVQKGSVVAQFMSTVLITADGAYIFTGLKFDPSPLYLKTVNRITNVWLLNLMAEDILKTHPVRQPFQKFCRMCDERVAGLMTTAFESMGAWFERVKSMFYALATPRLQEPDKGKLDVGQVRFFFYPTTLQSLSSLAAPTPMTYSVVGKMVLAAHWAIVAEFHDQKRLSFEGERKFNAHSEEYLLTCSPSESPDIEPKDLFPLGTKSVPAEKLFEIAYHVPCNNKRYDVVSNNCHRFVREFLSGIDADLLSKLEEVIQAS